MEFNAIDIFSGIGGLSLGLHQAGFTPICAIEIDSDCAKVYEKNFPGSVVITKDIRKVKGKELLNSLNNKQIHLLAGCPPCQGFSSIKRLNKNKPAKDDRNKLILEFKRLVSELKPYTFMLENVPGLSLSKNFKKVITSLEKEGYSIDWKIVNIKDYGVPQSRKRLVAIGSRIGMIPIDLKKYKIKTVEQAIGNLKVPDESKDKLHKVYAKHSEKIYKLICDIPKNGGSRKDLGADRQLACHKKDNIGFNDVYGRLSWDKPSTTITGGCLNPSKGRFLHPVQNRCITAREAALLQSFPKCFKIPSNLPKTKIALMIGNALPPKFSRIQSKSIIQHLSTHFKRNAIN